LALPRSVHFVFPFGLRLSRWKKACPRRGDFRGISGSDGTRPATPNRDSFAWASCIGGAELVSISSTRSAGCFGFRLLHQVDRASSYFRSLSRCTPRIAVHQARLVRGSTRHQDDVGIRGGSRLPPTRPSPARVGCANSAGRDERFGILGESVWWAACQLPGAGRFSVSFTSK
jgi:hypothetical protein